jgi:hypothetical protein
MKTVFTFLLLAVIASTHARAQFVVLDVANLTQSITNYAALIEQLSRQATQISNQVRQIQQFETELKRMGDMASVTSIIGFPEFRLDLALPSKINTWADGLTLVNGTGLFGDTRGGIFRGISSSFTDFDGTTVARDPAAYKEAHDIVVTVDEFKAVQSDVYARREKLKEAIARTSEALQAAPTEAEEMKLEAVLNAQYSQLASVDAEVALSAAEVQVKAAESAAMSNAQSEADAEARSGLAQQEVAKLSTTFKPVYECLLQFVTERSLAP